MQMPFKSEINLKMVLLNAKTLILLIFHLCCSYALQILKEEYFDEVHIQDNFFGHKRNIFFMYRKMIGKISKNKSKDIEYKFFTANDLTTISRWSGNSSFWCQGK